MGASIDNYQPSLALTEYVITQGIYPSRFGNVPGGSGEPTMGMLRMFAGSFVPGDDLGASGQLIQIAQNTALFSLLGTSFGGNAVTNFALPNLGALASIGSGQGFGLTPYIVGETTFPGGITLQQFNMPFTLQGFSLPVDNVEPSLTFTYVVRSSNAGDPQLHVGEVVKFAGDFVPEGFVAADGRLVAITAFPDLFAVIGTTYGGDGVNTFAMPNLSSRDPVGASASHTLGSQFGSENIFLLNSQLPAEVGGLAQPFDNFGPSLALNYIICTQGIFPTDNGGHYFVPFYGEVQLYAGSTAPAGWQICDGSLLQIGQNQALFSLLGTTYGGDGVTNFALPDFRDRTDIGASGSTQPGAVLGEATHQIQPGEMPNLLLNGTAAADVLRGSGGNDHLIGNGNDDTLTGNGGNDTLDGGAGNDVLTGGAGIDGLNGGDGDDFYVLVDTLDTISDSAGSADAISSTLTRSLAAYAGIERLFLAGGAAIDGTGDGFANVLVGNGAANVLSGGGGDDTLIGGLGSDTLMGGLGNDAYYMEDGADSVADAGGADDAIVSTVSRSLAGYAGIERLYLVGGAAASGTGDGLANFIVGNGAANVLSGGGGDDTLIGGLGIDTLLGGLGNDVYCLEGGSDAVADAGGSGDTILSTTTRSLGNYAGIEKLYLVGDSSVNGYGNGLANVLVGNSAANRLAGGLGTDRLIGGLGDDTLIGGAGADVVVGGFGRDTFVFNAAGGPANRDVVVDFTHAVDAFQFENHVFATLGDAGPLSRGFFRAAKVALDANDHILYDQASGKLFYDSDGSGAHAQVLIAVLANKPLLSASDFAVI